MSAAVPARATFAHRSNRNGTTDSICHRCFATVATATWEADLDRAERVHACQPWVLQDAKHSAVRKRQASRAPHLVNA
jgi:hypothetical protein